MFDMAGSRQPLPEWNTGVVDMCARRFGDEANRNVPLRGKNHADRFLCREDLEPALGSRTPMFPGFLGFAGTEIKRFEFPQVRCFLPRPQIERQRQHG